MTLHRLKVWPEFFAALQDGTKTFEVRRDDRLYAVGDTLHLEEFDVEKGYTGRSLSVQVTYLLREHGLRRGFVVLGLKRGQAGTERDQCVMRQPITGCTPEMPRCIGQAARGACTCETVGGLIERLERDLRQARAALKHCREQQP